VDDASVTCGILSVHPTILCKDELTETDPTTTPSQFYTLSPQANQPETGVVPEVLGRSPQFPQRLRSLTYPDLSTAQ